MRRRSAIIAVALLVTACSRNDWMPPAQAYRHLGDRLKVYFPLLGMPCGASRVGAGGKQRADQCYRFGTSRQMSGVIASDGSWAPRFHEGKAEVREEEMFSPASNAASDRYRLIPPLRKVKLKSGVEVLAVNPDQRRRAYQVTFIGRETVRFPSRQTQSIVAIDRIEAIRRLP